MRIGSTLTEIVVAATLVVALIGVFTPMSVSAGRLWQQTRHHQLALDELSNQLDRLAALPAPQRAEELDNLTVSDAVEHALPEARLTANEVRDRDGARLVIELQWKRRAPSQPLTLTGWIRETEDE